MTNRFTDLQRVAI